MLELPVAGYFRVSVAREGMVAPGDLRREIARYCAFKRLAWVENFSDIDRSGWKGSRSRPGLNALVERRHEFSAVIVPKLSRFGRSLGSLARSSHASVLHDLRHSYATISLKAGVHPKVVSERLGHATVAFTLDRYSHAVPGMQEDAAEKVAALIFASAKHGEGG